MLNADILDTTLVSHINPGWYWYANEDADTRPVGKFMTFSSGEISKELQDMILEALHLGLTPLVKHTNPETMDVNPHARNGESVVIWYSSDNKEDLQQLASFLVKKALVPKTKTGRLYNISFKYDAQTAQGNYGDDYKPLIKLEDLLDLSTGEVLP